MSAPNRPFFSYTSDLVNHGKSAFNAYKQMTPTRNQSTLNTLSYLSRNRNHTYHFLGFDTGIKDYGAQILRNPGHAMNLYKSANALQDTAKLMEKRRSSTMAEINKNPVAKHGFYLDF